MRSPLFFFILATRPSSYWSLTVIMLCSPLRFRSITDFGMASQCEENDDVMNVRVAEVLHLLS